MPPWGLKFSTLKFRDKAASETTTQLNFCQVGDNQTNCDELEEWMRLQERRLTCQEWDGMLANYKPVSPNCVKFFSNPQRPRIVCQDKAGNTSLDGRARVACWSLRSPPHHLSVSRKNTKEKYPRTTIVSFAGTKLIHQAEKYTRRIFPILSEKQSFVFQNESSA